MTYGSTALRVTAFVVSLGYVGYVGVAHAGVAHLVFAESAIAYLAVSENTWQVWRMESSGKKARQVTGGTVDITHISCSADGQRILASTSQGLAQLIDLTKEAIKPVPLQPRRVAEAALSPDGTQVAFSLASTGDPDSNELYIVGVDGRALQKVFGAPARQRELAWSRDGRSLYFASGNDGPTQDLWRVVLETGTAEQLTANAGFNFDVAAGAGDTFVFSSNRTGDFELWLGRPNATPTRLTHHAGIDAHPSFSPNGKTIVFERVDNGVSNIWKLRVGANTLVQLTRTRGGARAPVWCGD
jgi:TolB protein